VVDGQQVDPWQEASKLRKLVQIDKIVDNTERWKIVEFLAVHDPLKNTIFTSVVIGQKPRLL